MAKDLSGFLFGNVDESGNLDMEDDFFDPQMKNDLKTFSKRNKGLQSLGIDEGGDRQTMTTASEFVPNQNAEDYEDIDELAEEIQNEETDNNRMQASRLARQAEANILRMVMQQQKPQDVEMVPTTTTTTSIVTPDNKRIYKLNTQNIAFETLRTILESPGVYSIEDLEFKTFASAKNGDGTVILKFSQFFAPRVPDKPRKRRKHRALPPLSVTEESMDYDEMQFFNQVKNRASNRWKNKEKMEAEKEKAKSSTAVKTDKMRESNSTNQIIAAAEAAAEEDDEYVPESFKETSDADLSSVMDEIDLHNFTTLQQTNWEDGIVWSSANGEDDEDEYEYEEKKSNSLDVKKISTLLYLDPIDKNFDNSALGKRKRWGMLEVEVSSKANGTGKSPQQQSTQLQQQPEQARNQEQIQPQRNITGSSDGDILMGDSESGSGMGSNTGGSDQVVSTQGQQSSQGLTQQVPSTPQQGQTQPQFPGFESKINKWSIFPIQNEELENGDWVNNIIWDETSIPKSMQNSILILDLNDKDMLFEEHMERLHVKFDDTKNQLPKKKKSKKRLALEASLAQTEISLASFGGSSVINPIIPPKPVVPVDKEEEEQEEQVETNSTEQLDPFNLSNDKYYRPVGRRLKVKQQQGKLVIHHSIPGIKLSLVKTHLSNDDLSHFHRPVLRFPTGVQFRLHLYHKQEDQDKASTSRKSSSGKVEVMKHKSELSAREGRVVLMEYLEQYPAIVSNVGMGLKMRNFYKKKDLNDAPLLNYEDGEEIDLEPNEDSPFLGDLRPGTMVQGVFTNLFHAPVYKHNIASSDFLLVRSKDARRWYIRELSTSYTIGQNLPEMEVPAPNSRNANMFLKSRLQAFIFRLFMKKSNASKRVKISDVCLAFPNQSETSIRKRLKDCADFQRGGDDSGWWTAKRELPTEEELQKLVTPESVCAYEAMLFQLHRLQDIGIIHFMMPGTIPTGNLPDDDPIKKKYKPVEDELNLTTWNLTSSFLLAMQGKGRMQLMPEDGSGHKDEYSYLKMPQKVVNQKQKAIKQALQKNQVTGTNADLRKLSLIESKNVLLELGVSEEVIDNLPRWERIDLVRKKSSEAALANDNNAAMTKFARGSRYSVDHQNIQYKEQAKIIFENQMKTLSGKSDSDETSLESAMDKSLADLQKDLEESLFGTSSKPKQRGFLFDEEDDDEEDEEEDRQEYNKLMNSNPSTPTLAGKPPSTPTSTSVNSSNKTDKDVVMSPINQSVNSSNQNLNSSVSNNPNNNNNNNNNNTMTKMLVDGEDLTTGDRMFVKKVTLFQKPDGTLFKRIEIIRDPRQVKEYQSKRPEAYKKKLQGTTEEDEKKREEKKLQDLLKKLQSDQKAQQSENLKASTNTGSTIINISSNAIKLGSSSTNLQQSQPVKVEPLNSSSTKIRIKDSGGYINTSSNSGGSGSSSSHHRSDRDGHGSSSSSKHHRSDRDGHSSSSSKHHRSDRDGYSSSSSKHHRTNSSGGSSASIQPQDIVHNNPQSPTTLTQSGSSIILKIKSEYTQPQTTSTSTNPSSSSSSSSSSSRKKKPLPPTSSSSSSIPLASSSSNLNEDEDLKNSSNSRRSRVRKDGGGAEVSLSNIFETIIENLRQNPEFGVFKNKVTSNIAPNYFKVVKNPIDLTTMRDKNRAWEYKSQAQFLDAINLMKQNCFDYNETRNPHLLPIAQKLLTVATQLVMLRESEISELEKAIETHLTSSTSLRPTSHSKLSSPTLSNISLSGESQTSPMNVDSHSETNYFPQTQKQPYEDEEIDVMTFSSNSPANIDISK